MHFSRPPADGSGPEAGDRAPEAPDTSILAALAGSRPCRRARTRRERPEKRPYSAESGVRKGLEPERPRAHLRASVCRQHRGPRKTRRRFLLNRAWPEFRPDAAPELAAAGIGGSIPAPASSSGGSRASARCGSDAPPVDRAGGQPKGRIQEDPGRTRRFSRRSRAAARAGGRELDVRAPKTPVQRRVGGPEGLGSRNGPGRAVRTANRRFGSSTAFFPEPSRRRRRGRPVSPDRCQRP